jgi:DNA-binding transcriptional MerR regulator
VSVAPKARARPSAQPAAAGSRRLAKSSTAFRTISEVASELDVPQHVLRFWETRFAQIRPLKRGGGRRYYRPEDVSLLKEIRELLYSEGYTIKGVQKLMRDGALRQRLSHGGAAEDADAAPEAAPPRPASSARAAKAARATAQADLFSGGLDGATRDRLRGLLTELETLRDRLRGAIR